MKRKNWKRQKKLPIFSLAVRLLITDVVGSTNTCFSNKNHFSNLPPLTEMHKYLRLQISIDLQKNDCKICRKDMTTLQKRGKLRDETQKCLKVVFIGGKPGKIAQESVTTWSDAPSSLILKHLIRKTLLMLIIMLPKATISGRVDGKVKHVNPKSCSSSLQLREKFSSEL